MLMPDDVKLADYCRDVVAKLLKNEIALPDSTSHIDEEKLEATLADHLLTTSALVACLAYDDQKRDILRLAALVHDMPVEQQQATLGKYADAAAPWVKLLREQGRAIEEGKRVDIPAVGSERALLLAHLAASTRKEVKKREEFDQHALNTGDQVALIYGGATKIKDYVFESAKLPEIRGASVLLDHINQLDLPAMWGRLPMMIKDQKKNRALSRKHQERYQEVRDWFADHFIMNALDAPECIIYASGGNILALAPASWGQRLATAIEYRYTDVTKVANSVGVSQCFSLLELQYGCNPTRFWIDCAANLLKSGSVAAQLLEQSLGRSLRPDGKSQTQPFEDKKGFGELVTVLAGLANRRRAGDGTHTGAYRFTSFFELSSHARKCMSCDVRPATKELEGARFFCYPCLKKQEAGRWARKGDLWQTDYKWVRPWGTWLEEQQPHVTVKATTDDLQEVGQLSDGFVGLISADGNDVGAYIAKLTSISGYRNFAKKMLDANEKAVAKALVEYVKPKDEQNDSWPFEVIAIGGDDVILFVPADKAIEVAKYIAQEFEAGLKDRGITGITLSAGVLLMPQSTPVRFATEFLVNKLLDSSKKIRYDNPSIGATVDFMALKSVTMVAESIELYRKAALEHKGRQNLRLTQRPYTLEQLDQVISATCALKAANFPRSQLYQLAHYIREGLLMRSAVDYAYLVQRGKERSNSKEAFERFDEEMIKLCNKNTWLPWRVLGEESESKSKSKSKSQSEWDYDTPLLDIIELYPFIGSSGICVMLYAS